MGEGKGKKKVPLGLEGDKALAGMLSMPFAGRPA